MQNTPRVSVGMPVYNGEKYLEKALDSVLSQTFSDFELIISDNASTDRTREICQTYIAKDPRIRYYRNEKNLGAAKNYNRVFEMCLGKYFKWVAHDDLYAPEYLERCVDILDRKPDIILCYPRTIFIDEDDQVIEYYFDGFDLRSPKPHKRFRDALYASSWCNPVLGLIRADFLRRTVLIGNYPSSDKVLLGELALLGQYYEIPEHLFFRRLHSQNSVKANTTDNALSAWFDPKTKGKLMAPRWKRLVEYAQVIRQTPMDWSERVHCYMELFHFYLSLNKIIGVGKDLRQIYTVIIGKHSSQS